MTDDTPMSAGMPQGEIASIVLTANEGEIEQGRAAASRATSSEVRNYAQMMVTDHTNALNAARDRFSRAGVTAVDNTTSGCLRDNGQRTLANLATYTGSAFDRAYMQSQVDAHQWLLTTLDASLIPSATGDTRALLETQRAAVSAHLDHARRILGTL
jgi:putative membrane protein